MLIITTKSGTLEIEEGESLLDVLEKNGYIIEYQCRSGYCGSCRLKLKKGQVKYNNPPLAFLYPDEILPCCCIVKEELYLDISRHSNSWQNDLFHSDELFESTDFSPED